ncbi:MAG: serine O-acetyltransferase [Verrucomicrobiaceae bacterium]|nr:serine O-acetyltransferase [Verrucomicrobiaceae bacterium]
MSEFGASPQSADLHKQPEADVELLWEALRAEADEIAESEPTLHSLLSEVVLDQSCLGSALGARMARKLAREDMPREELSPLFGGLLRDHPGLVHSAAADLAAIVQRDPACSSPLEPMLYYKGFLAITTYRVSHYLWHNGRQAMALYLQSLANEVFGVDIHPAAQIGSGILLDHATSFVVGETAIIDDNVSILHEVTLGGTGKESGARHPIVRSGVLIGAGAKILGRVEIGEGAQIGAGSVVLKDVPARTTVAGVPAEVVGTSREANPALAMDQSLEVGESLESSGL